MRRRILAYRKSIDNLLQNEEGISVDWQQVINEHLVQISFFQHERLIHLIVTMTVAVLTLISLMIALMADLFIGLVLSSMFLVLLVPYIFHYYLLENEVQKMYGQYDELMKKSKEA